MNLIPENSAYRLQDVPSFEQQLIDELVESGLDWEGVQSQVAEEFRSTIQESYREGMLLVLERRYGATVERLASTLRKTESQRLRWAQGDNRIGWETICEAMAAFNYQARANDFPKGRVAVCFGMVAAIKSLRTRHEGSAEYELGVEHVICLVECCRASFHEARSAPKDRQLRQKREAERISTVASTRTGRKLRWDWDAIAELRGTWMRYWVMFHLAIDYDWEY
jgi:hypothetical protein